MNPLRRPRALLLALPLVAVTAVLSACADRVPVQSAAAASASAQPSVTCPAPLTTTAAGEQQTVQSGGLARTYNVWLPTGYTGTKPVPVVVDFHGTSGQAVPYENGFSGMGKEAPAAGYLLVAPQATMGDATALRWRVPGTGEEPSDTQFTSDLLKAVAAKYCVDPTRYYATGFSSGGAFTTYVSCQLDVWAAVAPMSGVSLVQPCPTRPPVAMVTFHGTNDLFVPYAGLPGAQSTANPDGYYEGDVQVDVDQWAVRNKCQPTRIDTVVPPVGTTSGPGSTITKRTYSCPANQDVVMYVIDGTGHAYPGGPPLGAAAEEVGGQSQSIDAGAVLLAFFGAHKRTTPPNYTPQPEIRAGSPASVAATLGSTPASVAPTP